MPKLRRMSGQAAIAIFQSLGFEVYSQKGSHVKLRRTEANGERQLLTIPNHRELDTGTLRAIVRQASRYIPFEELQRYFCS